MPDALSRRNNDSVRPRLDLRRLRAVHGRLATAANGTDTLGWTYDDAGQLLNETSTKNSSTVAYTYDNSGNQPHKVELSASVKAEGGRTVFETKEERDSSELKGSAGGYGFTARIPLKQMAPGLYVLRVEATSRFGDRPTVATDTDPPESPRQKRVPRTDAGRPSTRSGTAQSLIFVRCDLSFTCGGSRSSIQWMRWSWNS